MGSPCGFSVWVFRQCHGALFRALAHAVQLEEPSTPNLDDMFVVPTSRPGVDSRIDVMADDLAMRFAVHVSRFVIVSLGDLAVCSIRILRALLCKMMCLIPMERLKVVKL